MTANRGPGVAVNAGVGTTTLEHRLQLAGQYAENAPGVPRSGVLNQGTALLVTGKATMAYDIGPAALVISRTAAEGVYTPTLTGTTTVTTTAAPASNSRWDLVYVKQNDTAKGDADNLPVVGVVQGASGASPTKPYGSVPAGGYVLAEAQIFSGTTGTSGGSNTIAQVWRYTASRGAPITVRNTTERAEITQPGIGQSVLRLDFSSQIETWDGSIWSSHKGISYSAVWTGATNFGTGGSMTGTYWLDGDKVTVRARVTAGTGASLGTGVIGFGLPAGLPIAAGITLGTAVLSSAGILRTLTAFASGTTGCGVWAPTNPVSTPGTAGYPFASGDIFEAFITYQTTVV